MTDELFQRFSILLRDGLKISKQGSFERRLPNVKALPKIREALKGFRELANEKSSIEVWRQLALAEEALLHYPAAVSALEKAIALSQHPDHKDLKRLALLQEYSQKWVSLGLTPTSLSALGKYLEISLGATPCNHSYKNTLEWICTNGIPNQGKILGTLKSLGGHCDCEVLANVI